MSDVKRLLIVDDEEILTFTLCQTFIKAPITCEVQSAASATEALEKCQKAPFDLIITDIAMPGMSGLELLEIVRRRWPHTRVVVMTAYGSPERRQEAMDKGASAYVEKPFELSELKSTVLNLIG